MSFLEKIKAKLNIKSKARLILFVASLIAIVASLTLGAITFARYISEKKSDGVFVPSKFYFESNLLTLDGAEYDIATDSITFDLKSYDDNLRHSEVDIDYEVSITCADGGVTVPSGINTEGTLAKGASRVSVQYNGLVLGKAYTVTASATAPYTKTISATFNLPDEDSEVTVLRDVSPDGFVATLTLKTGNVAKTGIVRWQDGYVPINAYAPMKNASGTSNNVTLEPNRTYVLNFLKSDLNADYIFSEFDFWVSNQFNDRKSVENLNMNEGITDSGIRIKHSNGAEPSNNYSVSGYIDITDYNLAGNPHIQFKFFWSDMRFILWDSNKNGKFAYGYINQRGKAKTTIDDSYIKVYDSNGNLVSTEAAPYPDAVDVTQGPVTLRWQVVINNDKAYWYINNELIYTLDNVSSELFCIGALNTNIYVYDIAFVAKSENEAKYNSILASLGIQ